MSTAESIVLDRRLRTTTHAQTRGEQGLKHVSLCLSVSARIAKPVAPQPAVAAAAQRATLPAIHARLAFEATSRALERAIESDTFRNKGDVVMEVRAHARAPRVSVFSQSRDLRVGHDVRCVAVQFSARWLMQGRYARQNLLL